MFCRRSRYDIKVERNAQCRRTRHIHIKTVFISMTQQRNTSFYVFRQGINLSHEPKLNLASLFFVLECVCSDTPYPVSLVRNNLSTQGVKASSSKGVNKLGTLSVSLSPDPAGNGQICPNGATTVNITGLPPDRTGRRDGVHRDPESDRLTSVPGHQSCRCCDRRSD